MKRKYATLLTIALLLLLCCALSMCTAALLPNPQAEPAAWSAMSEVAASNRLFAFLATITFGTLAGSPGAICALPLILVLLAVILWLARPGRV